MGADQARRLARRPAEAVDTVRRAAGAVSPRVRSVLSRVAPAREQWTERRLPLDASVGAVARRFVGEAFGGRVAVPVLERAQLVASELVSHRVLRSGESCGEVLVRLGLGSAVCRIEVETSTGAQPALSQAYLRTLSRRWGFERTAGGATRVWAELGDVGASGGEGANAAVRAGVGTEASEEAAAVHVVPTERAATWEVYDARVPRPMSEHATETEAEAAARMCARVRGRRRIVIHDRYHRTRETTLERAE